MAQPESVARGEEWVRAVNESFIAEDVGEWILRQSDSQVTSACRFDSPTCFRPAAEPAEMLARHMEALQPLGLHVWHRQPAYGDAREHVSSAKPTVRHLCGAGR